MEFKQLQSFVTVIKYQSFTKAADKLFVSQPTISAHINQLEEELGKRLILRTTKSIELTPKGKEVYEYAQSILDLRSRMIESCNESAQNTIHIGASTIPSAYILPELLQEFGAMNPDTYFSVHQSDSQGVIDGLREGLFDIGMIGMNAKDDQIKCVPFYQDSMIIITPVTEHFLKLKKKKDFTIKQLLAEPVIMREAGSGSKKTADQFLEDIGLTNEDLNIVARINDQEAIKNMVANGLGISIISEMAARNFLAEKRILSFSIDEASAGRNIYLIYKKDYILSDSVNSFLKYIRKKYIKRGSKHE